MYVSVIQKWQHVNLCLPSSQKSPLWGRDLQHFPTSKITTFPHKPGKTLPECTVSPWSPMGCVSISSRGRAWLCRSPSSPAGSSGSAAEPATLSLCSAEPRASPVLPARSLRQGTSQAWEVEHHHWVLNHIAVGNHNSSLEGRSVPQEQPGILYADTWGSALHCPFPGLHPARADHGWLTQKARV